jgi:ubiquitin-protein ligase
VRALPALDERGEDNLLAWLGEVEGTAGTPWEGRSIKLLLRFCGEWPYAPPLLFVLKPIPFHPNVDASTGAVCMDLLQEQWSPAGGVLSVLLSFRSLLSGPTLDDASAMPANVDAASTLLRDPAGYRLRNTSIAATMPAGWSSASASSSGAPEAAGAAQNEAPQELS